MLTLLPIIFGLSNYKYLPNNLAVNINLYANKFNYMSKPFVLIVIPIIFTVISLFFSSASNKNIKKYINFSSQNAWVCPIVSNLFLIIIISNTLNLESALHLSILFLSGLLLNFLGINLITNEHTKITKYFNIRVSNIKKIGYFLLLGSYIVIIATYIY